MATFKKNDTVSILIDDIGINGEGIGRIDGYTLFVKDAIIGDEVEVKITKAEKRYGYARVLNILIPSKDRIESECKIARRCGGCQIAEMSYEAQLRFKENKVKNNLERIGGIKDIKFNSIVGMEEPFRYRNKAALPIGTNSNYECIVGFYAGRTHSIIEMDDCIIGVNENKDIIKVVKNFIEVNNLTTYDEASNKGLFRHLVIRKGFKTDEIMVTLVINANSIPNSADLINALLKIPNIKSISISINKEKTNVILGKTIKTLYGEPYITDYIGDIKFRISPLSFYQVNPVQTKKLYEKALEYANLKGNEIVWDMYCGIGTITLFLANKAKKVYGVEIVKEAIEDANINAGINNITNVEFFVGKAEEVFEEVYQKTNERADVVVVDPPRKGCDKALLDTISQMKPDRVVYVSCDSATLARDLSYLLEKGYEVKECSTYDMFPGTVHVETCVLLSHKNPQTSPPSL